MPPSRVKNGLQNEKTHKGKNFKNKLPLWIWMSQIGLDMSNIQSYLVHDFTLSPGWS